MPVPWMKCMAAVCAGLLLAGCSGTDAASPPLASGLGCVDDSAHCVNERGVALKSMMADKSKAWVRAPATPSAYASGVRLWAFKSAKRELSCDELSIGKREADGAPTILRGARNSLSPAQISRGIMLAEDVGRELNNERSRRCRA